MTENYSKSQLVKAARVLNSKAATWGQVCKQISGMPGKVEVGDDKLTVKEVFALFGVQPDSKKNSYKPADIQKAWAESLLAKQQFEAAEDGTFTDNSWRTPLIAKARPYVVDVNGEDMRLYEKAEKGMHAISEQRLCRVVKAEDRRKGSDDIVVSAKVVLDGLVQSVFVDDTLDKVAKSAKAVAELKSAFVNCGTSTSPKWVAVVKNAAGVWEYSVEKKA